MARPPRAAPPIRPDYTEALELKTDDPDPRFNNALARGLAILRSFRLEDRMLGNVEIAERTGIPKPTVSRLTYTLTRLGYLHHRPETGTYELGPGVIGLAYPYLAGQTIPPIARPLMLQLAAETRSNIGLGVQEGLSVLYLEYALGETVMNRRQRVGFRVPLVRTATGRACIALMTSIERERIFEQIRVHYPNEIDAIRAQVDESLETYRTRGYCLGIGTFNSDTASVAVPFLHADGHTILAFNSTGNIAHQTPTRLARTGKRLIELVEQVAEQLSRGLKPGTSVGPS